LSFKKIQSRAVIGLLTGYNTLRKRLYVMGMRNNPTCRKCGTEEEMSVPISCECEALAALKHTGLCYFFLDPEDVRKLSIGAMWNFGKRKGLLYLSNKSWGTKGLF
jgi:Fe2+ transport system protein FeoA